MSSWYEEMLLSLVPLVLELANIISILLKLRSSFVAKNDPNALFTLLCCFSIPCLSGAMNFSDSSGSAILAGLNLTPFYC